LINALSLGADHDLDLFRTQVIDQLGTKLSPKLGFNETSLGGYTFWKVAWPGEKTDETQLIQTLAAILADWVIKYRENELLRRIITQNYYYLEPEERLTILTKAKNAAEGLERRDWLAERFYDYLNSRNVLNLEGFLTFRLGEYLDELEKVVDEVVDDYLMEKEFQEFIKLLRYFVEIQEPQIDLVHVVFDAQGKFQLFDRFFQVLGGDYRGGGVVIEYLGDDAAYEDVLVSSLISLAPRQIVLHVGNEEIMATSVKTLCGVFEERISFCAGCTHCLTTRGRT